MAVTCPEGFTYNEQLRTCVATDFKLDLGNNQTPFGIDLRPLYENRPPPVIQGEDGEMYRNNSYLTANGWVSEPDYTTPLYFFHQPLELGDPREIYYTVNEDGTVNQFGAYRTEEDIRGYWDADEGMGYFKEANPDLDFDTWFSFIKESSALNASGLNRSDNPAEFQALVNQYGINTSFQNPDGDLFQWNGSSFTKTFKTDDSFNLGGLIMSLAAAALTGGLMQAGYLGSFLKGLSAAQQAAVINGVSTAIQTGGDLKSIAGSVVGSWAGGTLGGFVDLGSDAANSALSSSIASAVEQGIVTGELNVDSLLQSGILGGLGAIGKDLVDAFVNNEAFDFGGLLSEDSDLFKFFNGPPNIYGDYVSGALGDIKAAFNQFVEQNITGGEWWSSATESYDEIKVLDSKIIGDDGNIIPAGSVVAIGYDGSKTIFDSFAAFVDAGFTEMAGTNPIWGLINSGLDSVPDSWYDTLQDWINDATSGSSGGYTTEGGTTITTTTGTGADDDGEGEDPSLFDCSTVNRVQTPSALEAEDCGPCIEGYQADEFGVCVDADTPGVCPAGQVYNEVVGACVDELFFTPGQPCNTEDGQQGIFDDEGGCYVPAGTDGSTGTDDVDGDDGDSTGTTGTTGAGGEDDSCSNGATVESGCELCEDGSRPDEHQGGRCSGAYIDSQDPHGCSAGKPSPATFALKTWYAMCDSDYCNDGSRKQTVDGVYGANCAEYVAPTPIEPCADPDRRTTNSGFCAELCNDGTIPDQHEDGLCGNPMIATAGGEEQNGDGEDADCTLVECDSPRPEGAEGDLWDQCCTDVTTTTTGGEEEEPDCTLVECDSPRPEGIEGDLWDQCCTDTTTATTGSGSSGAGGGGIGGGGNLFEGVDLQAGITRDPSLEVAKLFPITNYLAGIFTGGRNV